MEAAATITQVAATVPKVAPVIEGAVTATKVAPFVEGAVTTTDALSAVKSAEIVSKAAGTVGDIEKAAPDALKAAAELEQGFETLPKGASSAQIEAQLNDFVTSPIKEGAVRDVRSKDVKSAGVGEPPSRDAAVTSDVSSPATSSNEGTSTLISESPTKNDDQKKGEETDAATQFNEMLKIKTEEAVQVKSEIDQQVEIAMFDWDEKHPIPADKKEYNKYVQERAAAEKEYTVSARVETEMQAWKNANPKATDKDIATQKQILEKKHSKNYDREVRDGQKEHDGMSAAEFAKKVEELRTLRAAEARMIQAIAKNMAIKNRTPEINAQQQFLQDLRNQYSAQADALQSVLEADAATSKSGWKRMILPGLMVGMVMAGPAMEAAKDDGSK